MRHTSLAPSTGTRERFQEVAAIATRNTCPHTLRRRLRRRVFITSLTAALTLGALLPAPYTRSAPTHSLPAIIPVHAARQQPQEAPGQPAPDIKDTPALASPLPTPDPIPDAPNRPQKPAQLPDIHASSAILVDAISGQVLYERNADAKRPMASTTKIMTALLFCEHLPETAMLTASKHASEIRESSLHLKQGERISAHDMLRAILMRSANDACVCAGENIAGSEQAFVAMMNARAKQLGATNTHFMNPHGLQNKLHYTTARDLATIARAAVQQPRINEVTRTAICRIIRSKDKNDVTLRNHSHFLGHFPGADGIKTGWTRPAGHCYVGSATQHNWRLISVVLNSPNYVAETAALMKYGFAHFVPHVLARAGEKVGVCTVAQGLRAEVPVVARQTVQVVLAVGKELPIETHIDIRPAIAPLTPRMVVGEMQARVAGRVVCATPLVPAEAVSAEPPVITALVVHSRFGNTLPWLLGSLFTASLVSLIYGKRYGNRIAALAKGARRRRRRLAARLRNSDL